MQMIGKMISQYRILEKLGEGGMGIVYKAEDTKLKREVAIKFLPHNIDASPEERERFKIEAQAAAALNHPNIATIYAIEEIDGESFIVMEYINGRELEEIVRAKGLSPLPVDDVINYATQIADGLQAAHEKGIIHRDIKSANIMITEKKQIKIMDFGLAKVHGGVKITKEHTTLGTAAYMSPEQVLGEEIDFRTDIWSFGVVLYEMLTGQLPFRGEYEHAVLYAIVNENPEPVEIYRSDIPLVIIHILDRTLEKEAEDRYQSMTEIARELHRLKKHNSDVSRKPFTGTSTVQGSISSETGFQRTPDARNTKQRSRFRKLALWIISSIIVATITFQIYWFFSGKKSALEFQNMEFSQLTHTGNVTDAAISPDGKWLVYTIFDKGKYSVWVRQLAITSNVQITTTDDMSYYGLAFSPDANFVYYTKGARLYRIPALGGSPEKLLEGGSRVAISPSGKQLAFVRYASSSFNESLLVVADIDGTNERVISKRASPHKYLNHAPAWSPDGNSIAVGVRTKRNGIAPRSIVEVQLASGAEKPMTSYEWRYLTGEPCWLPNGSGVVVVGGGSSRSDKFNLSQLWHVALPSGEVSRITNDLSRYVSLSVSADGTTLVTVQDKKLSGIWVLSGGTLSQTKQVDAETHSWIGGREQGISWTPDDKIVYSSDASGNLDIWKMDADGSNKKQLTFREDEDIHPVVLPDGRTIVFVSGSKGTFNLWRMDIDGGNAKQLMNENVDCLIDFDASGEWVVYTTFHRFLNKTAIEGGEPVQLTDYATNAPAISPDGKQIVCTFWDEAQGNSRTGIIPITGGKPTMTFDGMQNYHLSNRNSPIQWTRDSRALTYVKTENNVSNIWLQPLDGGNAKQLTYFKTDRIWHFTWSQDGKQLAIARGRTSSDVVMIRNFR